MINLCPCHSGKPYPDCCEPYHNGRWPLTPLALMRSRYAAYALGKVGYILRTQAKSLHGQRSTVKFRKELKQYCQSTQFVGLHILDAPPPNELQGWVTFQLEIIQNDRHLSMTEKSFFKKIDDHWLYIRGEFV